MKKLSRYNGKIVLLLIILFFIIFLFQGFRRSLFLKKKDRLNIVVFDRKTVVYSLGIDDNVNYIIPFNPDVKIKIPGGYGYYKIGALAKLVSLEKNPDLFRKSFSLATASFVDYYFYQPINEIYYEIKDDKGEYYLPKITNLIMFRSNAGFFDKIFIVFQLLGKKKNQFTRVEGDNIVNLGDNYFQEDEFAKQYQGYLYRKTYRNERKSLQIIYKKSYITAQSITKIIEGNGIRISDISQNDISIKGCQISESSKLFSKTAQDLADFFNCSLKKGKTELSDIIMILGEREKNWEVK